MNNPNPTDADAVNVAAIDIGSNAARLLIKSININSEQDIVPSKELFLRIPIRLGFDVFETGKISRLKADKLYRTIKAYKQLMKLYNVDIYRATATSAMRDAANSREIIDRIAKRTGINIEVISGNEESQIIYDNHIPQLSKDTDYLFVDVGGGSTEVTLVCGGEKIFSNSYNIGTIRLLKSKVDEEIIKDLKADISSATADVPDITIVGSGGNINKLYKLTLNGQKGDSGFTVEALRSIYNTLSALEINERIEKFNLKTDRADVIVPAAYIFLLIADSIGCKQIIVPNRGLADGIIDRMAQTIIKKGKVKVLH
ncbi:MAG: Ppx/GppA family phosphatase [Bacteroidia bacterium]|nr:Ppx/GppA family phosphatase [Bacteroidia bacterium]